MNSSAFWKGFRKGVGQGAMFSSLFFGLGTYVLLFQHRWWTALAAFFFGCVTSWLGMKIWLQESSGE